MDNVWRCSRISPPTLPLVRTTSSKCVTSDSYHVVVITTIRVNNMRTTGQQCTGEWSVTARVVWRSWKAWWICASSYWIRLPFPYNCIRYTYWNWNPDNRIFFYCGHVMLILTEEFAVNLGKFLRWRKASLPPSFMGSSWCIALKHIGLKCSRVLCVWNNTDIFCSVLCY